MILLSATTIAFLVYMTSRLEKIKLLSIDKEKMIPIEDCNFQTGDLILSANQSYDSSIVRFFGNNIFSHISMVYRTDTDVYLVECTPEDFMPDVITKKTKDGVHIGLLRERLTTHPYGIVAWRRLETSSVSRKVLQNRLAKGLQSLHHVSTFDRDYVGWMNIIHGQILGANHDRYDTLYCSKFVVLLMQIMGLLDPEKNCSHALPKQFTDPEIVGLMPGFRYGRLQFLGLDGLLNMRLKLRKRERIKKNEYYRDEEKNNKVSYPSLQLTLLLLFCILATAWVVSLGQTTNFSIHQTKK